MRDDSLMDLVYYATMAPSGHNTQPWRFVRDDPYLTICPDPERRLGVVDPDDHALFISLGCALENLLIAAEQAGIDATVAYPGGDAASAVIPVRLESGGPATRSQRGDQRSGLFGAIPERQSTRRAFDRQPLSQDLVDGLAHAASEPLVNARLIRDAQGLETIAQHVAAACQTQFENPAFVAELTRWIRFSRREARSLRDGLSAHAMGLPWVPRWLGQRLLRIMTQPRREARRSAEQVRSSSAVMVFSALEDTSAAWIRAGQGFERMALWATANGLKHAHTNMPCEVPGAREPLARALGLKGRPLLVIRIGYAAPMPFAYRRPLTDVIQDAGSPRGMRS